MILTRRTLLKHSRLAAVSAFMPALVSRAAPSGPFTPPRNFLFIYHPNGLETGWKPSMDADGLKLSSVLQALEPYKKKLLAVHGLVSGIRREVQAHAEGMTGLLTGALINDPAEYSLHPSVDQLIAKAIYRGEPLRSLELGVQSQAGFGAGGNASVMVYGATGKIQPEDDPRAVFRRLFGTATSPQELARQKAENKSILDFVRGDLAVVRQQVSATDAQKIEAHAEGLRVLEERLQKIGTQQCDTGKEPQVGAVADNANFGTIASLQMDMAALALKCQVTRVVTLQLANSVNDRQFPNVNPDMGVHGVMHSGTREQKQAVNRYFVGQVAQLLSKLEAVATAPGRTLLDDTLVVWGSEMAVGNHLRDPIPFFIAGGGSDGYFHHNRLVEVSDKSRTTRLLISAMRAFGIDTVDALGDLKDDSSRGPLRSISRVS
jgi:Protein of unknown function (DUF1552)